MEYSNRSGDDSMKPVSHNGALLIFLGLIILSASNVASSIINHRHSGRFAPFVSDSGGSVLDTRTGVMYVPDMRNRDRYDYAGMIKSPPEWLPVFAPINPK